MNQIFGHDSARKKKINKNALIKQESQAIIQLSKNEKEYSIANPFNIRIRKDFVVTFKTESENISESFELLSGEKIFFLRTILIMLLLFLIFYFALIKMIRYVD